MTIPSKSHGTVLSLWEIPSGELVLFALGTVLFCALTVWQHGRAQANSEVSVQSMQLSGERLALPAPGWRLDINTAAKAELELLPGIGPHRAQAILDERKRRGAFRSIWDLSEVPGLSKTLVQRLEPLIRVESPPR